MCEIDPQQKSYSLWINDSEYIDIVSTSVVISKLLFNIGFEFCSIKTGGGISEISHSGVDSYDVKYTDFSNFENNFYNDLSDAEAKASSKTGGWVSSLDYRDISIFLKKGQVRLMVVVFEKRVLIRAYEYDNSFDMSSVVNNVVELLNKSIEIEEIVEYIEEDNSINEKIRETMKRLEKVFLSNWTNEPIE